MFTLHFPLKGIPFVYSLGNIFHLHLLYKMISFVFPFRNARFPVCCVFGTLNFLLALSPPSRYGGRATLLPLPNFRLVRPWSSLKATSALFRCKGYGGFLFSFANVN